MKKQAPAEWYNKTYQENISKKLTYSAKPENTQYFGVWKTVIDMISPEEWIGDLGCGVGQFAELAIKSGKKYLFGVDFSEVAIAEAIKRNPSKKDYFIVANLDYGVLWTAFNVAVCLEVLEHLDNDTQLLQSIPSGKRVIFSVPSYDARAHVRFFKTETEVKKRYKYHVEIKSITPVPIGVKGDIIYIVDGIR